jgi:hypothetical protein
MVLKIDVSKATFQKHVVLLEDLRKCPGFQKVQSKYKIQSNGKTFRVLKRRWFGFWRQTKSSICLISVMSGNFSDGVSLEDAYCAMVKGIERDLQSSSKKHKDYCNF